MHNNHGVATSLNDMLDRNKKKDESGAGPSSAATSASKPDPNHIYVEGLNIKVGNETVDVD